MTGCCLVMKIFWQTILKMVVGFGLNMLNMVLVSGNLEGLRWWYDFNCPFDNLPCKRSGDCGYFCLKCNTVHPTCSRFDSEKFNKDISLRRLFGLSKK